MPPIRNALSGNLRPGRHRALLWAEGSRAPADSPMITRLATAPPRAPRPFTKSALNFYRCEYPQLARGASTARAGDARPASTAPTPRPDQEVFNVAIFNHKNAAHRTVMARCWNNVVNLANGNARTLRRSRPHRIPAGSRRARQSCLALGAGAMGQAPMGRRQQPAAGRRTRTAPASQRPARPGERRVLAGSRCRRRRLQRRLQRRCLQPRPQRLPSRPLRPYGSSAAALLRLLAAGACFAGARSPVIDGNKAARQRAVQAGAWHHRGRRRSSRAQSRDQK